MVIMQQWYFNSEIGAYTGDLISFEDIELPDRPSPRHGWKNGGWVLEPWYDWQGLKNAMRGSPFFGMAIGTSNTNAFSLMLSTFDSGSTNEGKMQDFVFAVAGVRAGMPVDYSEEQLMVLRSLLEEYGFPVFL